MRWLQVRSPRRVLPWSLQSADGRFIITKTTTGVNLLDRETQQIDRVFTVPGAKAIASARVGDNTVYRGNEALQ